MISEKQLATVDAAPNLLGAVNVTVQVSASIEKVWRSLTEADVVAQWFGELSSDLVSGGSARLDFDDGDFFDLDSIVVSPPDVIQYDWRFLGIGPCDSITWRIKPNEAGCLVTVNDMQPGRSAEAAMMLRESFGLLDAARRIEDAVETVLASGARTADVAGARSRVVGTRAFAMRIAEEASEDPAAHAEVS